jgi:isoleucyl-tRNA synthetase
VTASDYREDIRISENILKQLSEAYRRIRNTARFMLGNLENFDPRTDAVPYGAMVQIDRFALHRLQELTEIVLRAYANFDFHVIYHRLHNFCTLDLSAFYLDVLKDRLYTSPPDSSERRSAQTAMYLILDAMTRLMAPILAFTAEEIWAHLPAYPGKAESVHLAAMPVVREAWRDNALQANWEKLLAVRGEVTKALEAARIRKLIGHPLDAAVTLSAPEELYAALAPFADQLRAVFIVSWAGLERQVQLENAFTSEDVEGLQILVERAAGEKCERCWVHEPSVGSCGDHPTICNRCKNALERITAV